MTGILEWCTSMSRARRTWAVVETCWGSQGVLVKRPQPTENSGDWLAYTEKYPVTIEGRTFKPKASGGSSLDIRNLRALRDHFRRRTLTVLSGRTVVGSAPPPSGSSKQRIRFFLIFTEPDKSLTFGIWKAMETHVLKIHFQKVNTLARCVAGDL